MRVLRAVPLPLMKTPSSALLPVEGREREDAAALHLLEAVVRIERREPRSQIASEPGRRRRRPRLTAVLHVEEEVRRLEVVEEIDEDGDPSLRRALRCRS